MCTTASATSGGRPAFLASSSTMARIAALKEGPEWSTDFSGPAFAGSPSFAASPAFGGSGFGSAAAGTIGPAAVASSAAARKRPKVKFFIKRPGTKRTARPLQHGNMTVLSSIPSCSPKKSPRAGTRGAAWRVCVLRRETLSKTLAVLVDPLMVFATIVAVETTAERVALVALEVGAGRERYAAEHFSG